MGAQHYSVKMSVDQKQLKAKLGDRAPCPLLNDMTGERDSLADVVSALGNRVKVKRLPFSKSITEHDTGWDLPSTAVVLNVFVQVTTGVASSTIDVGLKSSESGGDADGFLDGASCANTGVVFPILTSTSSGGQTIGALLSGTEIKSADTTAIYYKYLKPHYAGSVTAKSVTYTTSDHTIAGYIYIVFFELALNSLLE